MEWLYTLAGLGVGFIVGLTGVGGGSLMTPLLVMAFGMPPSTAVDLPAAEPKTEATTEVKAEPTPKFRD